MSDPHNALLIDAGNTNAKYCFVNRQGEFRLQNDFQLEVAALKGVSQVVMCSVREPSFAQSVKDLCLQDKVPFRQIFTQSEAFGTRCAYQNYQTLGVDRWMNILAVAAQTDQTVLTFSIGTAMTIDIVHNKQHIGGWITPGFDMSKQALFNNTSGVFGNQHYPKNDAFGESTSDCVNFGCRALVNGLLREALQQAKNYNDRIKIVVFGGGLNLLNQEEFPNLQVDELLVFKGLSRFI